MTNSTPYIFSYPYSASNRAHAQSTQPIVKLNHLANRVYGVKPIWLKDRDGYWIEINDARD